MSKKTHLRIASVSVNGNVRVKNEDNYYINGRYLSNERIEFPVGCNTYKSKEHVVAVFDGMGGEKKGDLASLVASRGFSSFHEKIKEKSTSQELIKPTFDAFIKHLNDQICLEAEKCGVGRIGTTMAAMVITEDVAQVFNLGDSRVYLYRRKSLRRLTNDHNEAAMMIKLGMLTPESARNHPAKYRLTQHLGINNEGITIEPESYPAITLIPGDVFLLCSDGLVDEMTDKEIADYLDKNHDVEIATTKIIDEVLKRDAKDNITIISVQVEKITSFLGFKV